MLDENWNTILNLLPTNWCEMGHDYGAVSRLRGVPSEEALLRILLIHVARGYSLRETSVIAKQANIATISDVALLKRLRSSEQWLWAMCKSLFLENAGDVTARSPSAIQFKAVDGSIIREPGKTGSQWLLHYSLRMPSLECDEFTLLPSKGENAKGKVSKTSPCKKVIASSVIVSMPMRQEFITWRANKPMFW